MDAPEILRHMVEKSGKTYRQIAREIGRSESFVSTTIAHGACPRLDTFAAIAGTCGYQLVLKTDDEQLELVPWGEGDFEVIGTIEG